MARIKLTDGLVTSAEPQERETFLWDETLPRFGVRISPQGGRFYLVQYRAKAAPGMASKVRRVYLGRHDGELWNVTKARAAARKILAPVDLDRDPFAEGQAQRQADHQAEVAAREARIAAGREAERRETETFAALAETYITRRLGKRRSGGEAARLLRHGPVVAWGALHISEIGRRQVAELLEEIGQRSGAVARSTYAELRPFFD